jgi:hypothetical protein
MSILNGQDFTMNFDYDRIVELFSDILGYHLDRESWFFVFIQAEQPVPFIYANNPIRRLSYKS